jgi:UDP-glucose-4-epimerase GalE
MDDGAEPGAAVYKLQGRVVPVNVLVTGGAGYIGSHLCRAFAGARSAIVVLDDLSSGHREAVPHGVAFVHGDVRDAAVVRRALDEHHVEAVLHFASRMQVGESVRDPRLYYRDNLAAGIALLETLLDHGVRAFILSSTAAVYGNPTHVPIDESHATVPVNPYGAVTLAIEGMLASYAAAYGLKYATLRYFNAAGAGEGLSERHDPETHLIPLALDAAMGVGERVTIHGDDYATADGTCVRDYVHVSDLADAHVATLGYLMNGGASGAWNLGTGTGSSVREVLAMVERVTGRAVPVQGGPRRKGDPPVLVASAEKAKRELGWVAKRSGLERIVRDAFEARFPRAVQR